MTYFCDTRDTSGTSDTADSSDAHLWNNFWVIFVFKSTGDGCNSVICHCDVDAKNAKTGKVSCAKTHVNCPPKGSKDSGGEFPIFQKLFLCVLFLYKTYSKQTDNLTTLFHVMARSAKKGSTGKRLPVSVFAKKHFLTDFSSNQQVMDATQLSAIVTLMLRMLKPAKCSA